jgi:hypothetical protein
MDLAASQRAQISGSSGEGTIEVRFGVNVTFILNLLHSDMSILATDRKALAEWPVTATPDMTVHSGGSSIVRDYKKITLNSSRSLALGIAGHTQDHYYTQKIEWSVSVDEGLSIVRKHMESFLRVHDRAGLSTLTSFAVNEGIASFFDQGTGMYFSNTFRFSPVGNETRLHRATDGVRILHAGSGSAHFEKAVGLVNIDTFIASSKNSCTPEECIPWMQDVFRRVSCSDSGSGAEAVFVVSTRSSPKYRSIEGR